MAIQRMEEVWGTVLSIFPFLLLLCASKHRENVIFIAFSLSHSPQTITRLLSLFSRFHRGSKMTILPVPALSPPLPRSPSPKDDAMELHRAFYCTSFLGIVSCDTSAVVYILARRNAKQRTDIEHEYRTKYSEELSDRLAKVLSGNLKTAVLLWMPIAAQRDATIIRRALTVDKKLEAATEILCSCTPSQLQHLKKLYHFKFGVYLECEIELNTSGDHQKILLAYISTHRHEGPEVNREIAQKDAEVLHKAGEKNFVHICSERSGAHLAAVSSYYHDMYDHSLKKAVKNEASGNFRHALLTIIQHATNPGKYFAKVLHKAMKGLGTNDTTLIRVIVTRAEIDMRYIKAEYLKKYKKTLYDAVHSDTSGHYRAFLLALL